MKLLLVEDEKRMAMALIELLRMEKYDVDHAADGLLAMEMIERGTYHGYFPFPQISEFRFKGQRTAFSESAAACCTSAAGD